jgi:Subtilase family
MSKKRQSEPSSESSSFLQWLWRWWLKLRPPIKILVVCVAWGGLILEALPPSLFHSFNCDVQNLPQNYRSSNGYFIDNQVIVVGPENQVENVIRALPAVTLTPTATTPPQIGTPAPTQTLAALATPTTTGTLPALGTTPTPGPSNEGALKLVEGCDLSYLDTRKDAASNARLPRRQLVMRLYEIPTGSDVDTVISQINRAKVNTQSLSVSVDPNYLTRLSDTTTDPCAHPGDPGSGGGHPLGAPGMADPQKTRDAFMRQWAFGSAGINMPSSPGLTGRGVRVGIFDTSPFRIPLPFFRRIGSALPVPLWFTNWDAGGTTMMSNHGLFVAELIHGIAPKSHIHLVRVLNEDGCGDLWTLNTGLHDFISHMSAWTGKLDKTVINMSLGFRLINNTEDNDTGSEQDAVGSAENDNQGEEETGATDQEAVDVVNEDVETLRSLLETADEMGAIMFAAAGNSSAPTPENPQGDAQEMEMPASDPKVYGVAATNMNGERSCYSNEGEVAAPGGDGGDDLRDPNNHCASRTSTWNQPGLSGSAPCTEDHLDQCPLGLISLVQTRYGPQYALWSGTSFATPLVSGLAALLYQEHVKEDVLTLIEKGASAQTTRPLPSDPDLGWGVINVDDSLKLPSYP